MTHTGSILKKMRTTRNLTQQQLADLLGVNKSAIGQIEAKPDCSTTTLRKWAEALDFEWEVAVREKDEKTVLATVGWLTTVTYSDPKTMGHIELRLEIHPIGNDFTDGLNRIRALYGKEIKINI